MAVESTHSVDGLLLGKDYLLAKKAPPNYDSVTGVGSFQPEKVISGGAQHANPEHYIETRSAKVIEKFQGHVGPTVPFFSIQKKNRREWLFLFSDFGTSGTVEPLQDKQSVQAAVEIAADAQQRLIGNENLAARIYSLIREQLFAFGTQGRIRVRPAWSHEYDDSTGVVIDVNVAADDNLRFLLWDSISEKLAALPDISQDDETFLHNNISLFVTTRD